MDYRLEDLIDIPLLQNLQDKLNIIYSFPSAIIDNDGKVLTSVAWQDICTKFHRTNPECEKECIKSDMYILEHLHEANPAVSYQCPHGLVDNATPIIIDGKHLGNFFTGQFFLEEPDLKFFKKQAKKYGFDEKAYLEAVEKVPIWTKEKLTQYIDFIKGFIELIAGLGLKNLQEIETLKTLKENDLRYRSLIESSSDAIFCVDEKGQYHFTNQLFASTFGKTPDYFIGKTFWDVYDKEHADMRYEATKRIFSTGHSESLEVAVPLPNKTLYFWATGNPVKDETGKVILSLTHAVDITERKLTEEALLQSSVFSESLLKTIPFGMDIVDETGTVLFQSDNFNKLFGESAIGKKCWELYRDDKQQCSACPLFKGINIGKTESYETHGVLGKRVFDISHTGMMYQGKKAMLEIFQDITERKDKDDELMRAKKQAEESDRLKSAFLANMSHEIRTPMNGIIGFTQLLKEPTLTREEQQDFIRTIEKSGERMLNTLNDIIDFSKIESGMMKVDIRESDINEQIEFVYNFFLPEVKSKGIQFFFKTRLPSKEAILNTDNEKVYVILTNLIKNAIKFTNNGSIEFGYDIVRTEYSAYLQFFVKDTGIGIPDTQKEMIFERFRQGSESYNRNYEGSGLGLSISKSYVEMLGGKIWVESEEGKGSTFYFTVPYNPLIDEKKSNQNVASGEEKNSEIRKLKILIAEDDEISYSLLSRILQNLSYEVLQSITGVEAVDVCRNNPDLDLVLMDIRMPVMDGYEATRQIRQFNIDVIIIAQTAYGFLGDKEKAIEAGCNDYITKPISKNGIFELIKKHCKK